MEQHAAEKAVHGGKYVLFLLAELEVIVSQEENIRVAYISSAVELAAENA